MAVDDNVDVITKLDSMITELDARFVELKAQFLNPPGATPVEKRENKRIINGQIGALNIEIGHLRMRRSERSLARDLGTAVPPISQERRGRLDEALRKVSNAISNVKTMRALLDRVGEIIRATSTAEAVAGTHA